jgi:hypothetical protein
MKFPAGPESFGEAWAEIKPLPLGALMADEASGLRRKTDQLDGRGSEAASELGAEFICQIQIGSMVLDSRFD